MIAPRKSYTSGCTKLASVSHTLRTVATDLVITPRVGGKLEADGRRSRTLSEDSDLLAVSSKCFDVFLNPLQSKSLVSQTQVHASSIPNLGAATQETPNTETVVDADANDGLADVD
jgi:hypothetical protein